MLIGAGVLAWLLGGVDHQLLAVEHRGAAAGDDGARGVSLGRARDLYVAGALLAIVAVVVIAAPPSLHFGLKGSGGSTSNATSGRTKLIAGGLELFADRPLWGYGSGSFETEYKRHGNASAANAVSASHTIPITVAAEQGIVGLAVYVALLVAAFATLFRGAGRSPPEDRPRGLLRGAGAAHVDVRGLPRGPDHVDAARHRRGAGPWGRAAWAAGASRF